MDLDLEWDGTSFTATGTRGDWTVTISGEASADGQSVYSITARDSFGNDIDQLVTNSTPIPLVDKLEGWGGSLVEVTFQLAGSGVAGCLTSYQAHKYPSLTLGTSNAANPPQLTIIMSP